MTASENKMETRIESMSDCRRKYPTAAGRAGLLLNSLGRRRDGEGVPAGAGKSNSG